MEELTREKYVKEDRTLIVVSCLLLSEFQVFLKKQIPCCECVYYHRIVHLKMVKMANFVMCILQ